MGICSSTNVIEIVQPEPVYGPVVNVKVSTSATNRITTLRSFETISILGWGGFASVVCAKNCSDGKYYAMKRMCKAHLLQKKALSMAWAERDILISLRSQNNPFLCRMHWIFQDSYEVYYVMELVRGGDLGESLKNKSYDTRMDVFRKNRNNNNLLKEPHFKRSISSVRELRSSIINETFVPEGFDEATLKLIAAEIIIGLESLHLLDIVYRDLKPKNILVTLDGHIMLTDFGLATHVSARNQYMTKHRAGTPGYMAPEMAKGDKYSFGVDIFALGVTLYELYHGCAPFDSHKFVKMNKTDAMKDEVWEYPFTTHVSEKCKTFITACLALDPEHRIGFVKSEFRVQRPGLDILKRHEWFNDINWEAIKDHRYCIESLKLTAKQFLQQSLTKEQPELPFPPPIQPKYQDFFAHLEWDPDCKAGNSNNTNSKFHSTTTNSDSSQINAAFSKMNLTPTSRRMRFRETSFVAQPSDTSHMGPPAVHQLQPYQSYTTDVSLVRNTDKNNGSTNRRHSVRKSRSEHSPSPMGLAWSPPRSSHLQLSQRESITGGKRGSRTGEFSISQLHNNNNYYNENNTSPVQLTREPPSDLIPGTI